jgi:TonB family protein
MSRRKILIGASIAGHAVLLAGVFVFNSWDLERLDHDSKSRISLAVMAPPAADSGSFSLSKPELKPKEPKKVVVKELTQPTKPEDEVKISYDHGSRAGTDPGTGRGTGTGDGPEGLDGEGCKEADGRPCGLGPALALPELPKPPPPPEVRTVTPDILKGLRIHGETQIHPPHEVKDEIYRSGTHKTSASIKLCLATNGALSSVTMVKRSKYEGYDEAILAAVRRWIYRPYAPSGTPVPACGMVTFVYQR